MNEPTMNEPTSQDPITSPIVHTAEFKEIITRPPTLEQAIAFLKRRYGNRTSEDQIREWYECMTDMCWADKTGATIRNWAYSFYHWRIWQKRFDAEEATRATELAARKQEADRRMHGTRQPVRADNFIRAKPEDVKRFVEGFI